MTDREVLARARKDAQKIKLFLTALGYDVYRVEHNGSADCPGYFVNTKSTADDPYTLSVEVIGSPWENDGTTRD